MPDREIEMLRGFLTQGGGHLSKRAREKEFHALTDEEATQIEVLYNELFGDFGRVIAHAVYVRHQLGFGHQAEDDLAVVGDYRHAVADVGGERHASDH